MQLKNLKCTKQNDYLHMYEAIYENKKGNTKKYEFVSRNKDLTKNIFTNTKTSNAVGMIVFNENRDKILLQKEFRMACGEWVYNFPGGLVDEGETITIAATRELKEETGLDMIEILEILSYSYTAVGISDETTTTVIGIAKGEISPSIFDNEEIEAKWFTKEEIRTLIKNKEPMSLRTQTFLWYWSLEEKSKF